MRYEARNPIASRLANILPRLLPRWIRRQVYDTHRLFGGRFHAPCGLIDPLIEDEESKILGVPARVRIASRALQQFACGTAVTEAGGAGRPGPGVPPAPRSVLAPAEILGSGPNIPADVGGRTYALEIS